LKMASQDDKKMTPAVTLTARREVLTDGER
jgi:hypothetical protein